VPAILPWPTTRVDGEKYQRNLLHQLRTLPADCLVTIPQLAENLRPGLPYPAFGCPIHSCAQFEKIFRPGFLADSPHQSKAGQLEALAEDALFLQFSGGTTGTQKCVVVTETMLNEQLHRLSETLRPGTGDGVVSWLPIYHDMGLIACLWFPLWAGIPSTHFGAIDWLLRPELLFELINKYNGTLCWLPNFAFSYLAQQREQMERTHSLQSVRAWVNCSEPVRLRSISAFARAFKDWGVERESLQASYAMAENVFAVTQTELGKLPGVVKRSNVRGSTRSYETRAFELIDEVSSGRCLAGMRTRVVRSDLAECAEREAGEIQISTSCLFGGYWNQHGFQRDSFTADGWYATGDYGFLADGELYVIGRMKDIIIVGGQNIFPEDLETIAGRVKDVYPGRVVAFGVDDEQLGTQAIAVVAEMTGEFQPDKARRIEQEIRSLIIASLGVAPRYVSVVTQRWIVKSTAGKISRRDTRNRFVQEHLSAPVAI
jgi:fatty-acyl-CoA synthase